MAPPPVTCPRNGALGEYYPNLLSERQGEVVTRAGGGRRGSNPDGALLAGVVRGRAPSRARRTRRPPRHVRRVRRRRRAHEVIGDIREDQRHRRGDRRGRPAQQRGRRSILPLARPGAGRDGPVRRRRRDRPRRASPRVPNATSPDDRRGVRFEASRLGRFVAHAARGGRRRRSVGMGRRYPRRRRTGRHPGEERPRPVGIAVIQRRRRRRRRG